MHVLNYVSAHDITGFLFVAFRLFSSIINFNTRNPQHWNYKIEPSQLPLALVKGDAITERPFDLYIPPDALEVFLESFEGPLDLLLYLIRKQKFDIADLPLLEITIQYSKYVEMMKEINLELAADYLVMAAMLTEIKSRILLPIVTDSLEEEEDPRAELVRQLIEYEQFKIAAQDIDSLDRMERNTFSGTVHAHPECNPVNREPEVDLKDLLLALSSAFEKADNFQSHQIKKETLSTRSRMSSILETMSNRKDFVNISEFYNANEGRSGVVVTFLAILELVKEKFLEISQNQPLSQIFVKRSMEGKLNIERVIQ